jgi:hypothetical protein
MIKFNSVVLSTVISLMAFSGSAFAHEGHGAPGLFHHFEQMAPAIFLVAIVAGILWKMKK